MPSAPAAPGSPCGPWMPVAPSSPGVPRGPVAPCGPKLQNKIPYHVSFCLNVEYWLEILLTITSRLPYLKYTYDSCSSVSVHALVSVRTLFSNTSGTGHTSSTISSPLSSGTSHAGVTGSAGLSVTTIRSRYTLRPCSQIHTRTIIMTFMSDYRPTSFCTNIKPYLIIFYNNRYIQKHCESDSSIYEQKLHKFQHVYF